MKGSVGEGEGGEEVLSEMEREGGKGETERASLLGVWQETSG